MTCPECGARSGHLLGCSKVSPELLAPTPVRRADDDLPEVSREPVDARQYLAVPVALLLAWALVNTGPGAFIGRTCFGMWLHELGHASVAWLSGRWAVPLPWFTWTFEGHSWLMTLLVLSGLGALVRYGLAPTRRWMLWAASLLGLCTLVLHLATRASEQLAIFGGDAGAMLFGAALVAVFLLPEDWRFTQRGLRWGWLVIGAISWADATRQWVAARLDPANIPFGVENGTASDASKLVDEFHWAEATLINRYLVVGFGALLVVGLLTAWQMARVHRRSPDRASSASR